MARKPNKVQKRVIEFGGPFNTVLWMVFVLTIFFSASAICLYLAYSDNTIFMVLMGLAEAGFGAIVGLLGGKMSK